MFFHGQRKIFLKSMDVSQKIAAIADDLKNARRVLVITGAGVSADSGLPTYRGVAGLYNDELTTEGLRIEDCLSSDVFQRRPEITWKYLWQIGENCSKAKPNRAHEIISAWQEKFERVVVFTQNIDDLHRRAGSRDLIEIHGNFHTLHCTRCAWSAPLNLNEISPENLPPKCPKCGGVARVPVVLFGEMLPEDALYDFARAWDAGFDAVFIIGTTCSFPYIARPVLMAAQMGIPTIEINLDETPVSHYVRYRLAIPAADALEKINVLL